MATRNEYPEKNAWWINELNSLGVNNKNIEGRSTQALENLADDVKQSFLHNYKVGPVD